MKNPFLIAGRAIRHRVRSYFLKLLSQNQRLAVFHDAKPYSIEIPEYGSMAYAKFVPKECNDDTLTIFVFPGVGSRDLSLYYNNHYCANMKRKFRVYVLDYPGSGYSQGEVKSVDDIAKAGADVIRGIMERDKIDPSKVVYWGHSFGGISAIRAANKMRHRPKAVVCDTTPGDVFEVKWRLFIARNWKALVIFKPLFKLFYLLLCKTAGWEPIRIKSKEIGENDICIQRFDDEAVNLACQVKSKQDKNNFLVHCPEQREEHGDKKRLYTTHFTPLENFTIMDSSKEWPEPLKEVTRKHAADEVQDDIGDESVDMNISEIQQHDQQKQADKPHLRSG